MKQAAEAATQNGGVNMKVTGDADSCENLPHHFGYVVITIPTRVVATATEARRSHRGIMLRIESWHFPRGLEQMEEEEKAFCAQQPRHAGVQARAE